MNNLIMLDMSKLQYDFHTLPHIRQVFFFQVQ